MSDLALLDSDLSEEIIQTIVESTFAQHGRIERRSGGLCGLVYFFDQGENIHPRWIAVKIPRTPKSNRDERNRRFMREMEIQHRTYYHEFVCHPFDYDVVHDTPAILYRCANCDLAKWLQEDGHSDIARLATLAYLTTALAHCRSRGVLCHQDLKPQNVLMRNYRLDFRDLPDEDVFTIPLLADFGLANLWIDRQQSEGAKPYMAPEQWLTKKADGASDIFSLGVMIFEVMSRGIHPMGERTSDWWPEPNAGNSKKWLRDEVWEKWAKKGCPPSNMAAISDDVAKIVRSCMSSSPSDRPSLNEIQESLLHSLKALDERAYEQACFRISSANSQAQTTESWPYLNQRLERLRVLMRRDGICDDG